MVQSPEVAVDKVCFLTLLREAHIWDRVTPGGQVGGSDGGDGEGEGEGEADRESDEEDGDGEEDSESEGGTDGEGDRGSEDERGGVDESDVRAVEVGKVGLEDGQDGRRPAQCM